MNKKLTLNLDEDIIDFARKIAKKTHRSISGIVENYFEELKNLNKEDEYSKKVTTLHGIFSDINIPDKKELRKYFHEKNIS
jgi:Cu/Ag efflux protein CusF